ncbi:MAG: hypothetical protein PWR12_1211 [Eubacteriaceae bacterium]|nr:hypothetical protein [Eubacteriaceae bacterium]MDK2905135.1 hypothetical protein [Eubacteriaceae bacterium]MDK2937497.1 hypothetical protein [Eubacteriaceae bacterium]MDK2961377.1 hypothetical protein [Eubacteriaceae bacterium]
MENNQLDYEQAVSLALKGEDAGFNYLYENTYKEKYYIAIKYMKDDQKAQDVLQDAYIRAFHKLDTLQNASAFPGWFGQIVANTAKNALAKKNPILFSEMNNGNVPDENWEYLAEDEDLTYQPESAYTEKETQEMVHELLESLSDEQRLCMLMFHIEDQSIKEIAEAFNCSENTVKSRLNYGRKKLKNKAEELEKKGYKLYSFAPLPLLLYLLRAEEASFIASPTIASATLFNKITEQIKMEKGVKEVVKEGAKQSFLHTAAGKIAVTVAGIVITGSIAAGTIVYHNFNTNNNDQTGAAETVEAADQESSEEQVQEWVALTDGDYTNMISGNLTKEQLECMLAYGPLNMTDGYIDDDTISQSLFDMINQVGVDNPFSYIENPNVVNGDAVFSTSELDRIYSVFKDNAFTNTFSGKYITVEGDVTYCAATTSVHKYTSDITNALYLGDEMVINYDVSLDKTPVESMQTPKIEKYTKTAYLEKQPSGLYQIKNIVDGTQNPQQENTQQTGETSGWQQLYAQQLETVKAGESDFRATLPEWEQKSQIKYDYVLCDLNGDTIPELIVNTVVEGMGTCQFFTVSDDGASVLSVACPDTIYCGAASSGGSRGYLAIPASGGGLYACSFSSLDPTIYVTKYVLTDGTLVKTQESTMQRETDNYNAFSNNNQTVEWTDSENLENLQGVR